MRLTVLGSGSFIAKHIIHAAHTAGVEVLPLPHGADLTNMQNIGDVLINCALHPDFIGLPYDESRDLDLHAARHAAENNAHFIMLSSRRVYPPRTRWGATEDGPAEGDETPYGKNKAVSEAAVSAVTNGRATILRLSNIIGFEYQLDRARKTFMATVLQGLRSEQRISFDMSPNTGRDFLPVEVCAGAIVRVVQQKEAGIYNVGCGFAVPCGDIADAVLKGFGSGALAVTNDEMRDAFYLNVDRWNKNFSPLTTRADLMTYCEMLGWRLRNA